MTLGHLLRIARRQGKGEQAATQLGLGGSSQRQSRQPLRPPPPAALTAGCCHSRQHLCAWHLASHGSRAGAGELWRLCTSPACTSPAAVRHQGAAALAQAGQRNKERRRKYVQVQGGTAKVEACCGEGRWRCARGRRNCAAESAGSRPHGSSGSTTEPRGGGHHTCSSQCAPSCCRLVSGAQVQLPAPADHRVPCWRQQAQRSGVPSALLAPAR